MTHLTMTQLLELRAAPSDPGSAEARRHLEGCPACQAEMDRLHQRVARLKALPTLRPSRNAWPAIQGRLHAERMRRRKRVMGAVGLAMAASIVLLVVGTDLSRPDDLSASAAAAIDTAKAQSRALENTINWYNPQARVVDGRTARIAAELEDRIAELDRQLENVQLQGHVARDRQLRLWRERVGLLNALVDVHVTRASNVGL